jgi:hypothetical protein
MAFFLAPLLAKLTASAIGKAAVGGVVGAVAANIGRKTTKPSIDLVGMRNDAMKAGFNPLTVMRNGGMSGYMIPAMSKQSFVGQMLGGAMTNAYDAWANKDIDRYNGEIRRLDIKQRLADLAMTGIMSRKAFSSQSPLSKDSALVQSDGQPLTDKDGNVIYYPSTGSEVIPKYRLVFDQSTGGTYSIINPELTESGISETATGLAMDAAGQSAAISGTGLSYGGFGFASDPYGLNRGFRSVSGSNMSIARPALSFSN